MKKKFVVILFTIVTLVVLSLTACTSKNNFKTKDEIKENYQNFLASIDLNGIKFKLIKTKKGYYLGNDKKSVYLYYNKEKNTTYTVDNTDKTLLELGGNYDFSKDLESVMYLLLYHVDNKTIKKLNKEQTTYLNRDVTRYHKEVSNKIQDYYIDNTTGACIYFKIDNGDRQIICKLDELEFGDNLLDVYEQYELVVHAIPEKLLKRQDVIKLFKDEYDVSFKNEKGEYRFVKDANCSLFSITKDNVTSSMLFDATAKKWYQVDEESKVLIETTGDTNTSKNDKILFDLVANYTQEVNELYYVKDAPKYLGNDVIKYEKVLNVDNTIIKEYFIVDASCGICYSHLLNIDGVEAINSITEIKFSADLSKYFTYKIEKSTYTKWPSEEPILDGVDEITYGTFFTAYNDQDGLNIVYKDITTNNIKLIIEKLKENGFTNILKDDAKYDATYTKIEYYDFIATSSKDVRVCVQYIGSDNSLLLIFAKA